MKNLFLIVGLLIGIAQSQVFAASGGSSDEMGQDEALKECIYSDTSEQGSKSGGDSDSGDDSSSHVD